MPTGPDPSPSTVVLDIPAKAEYVVVVRQVVSIIAGRDGHLSPSRVDDLILAVSEACSNAIESYSIESLETNESTRVVVRVTEEEDRLVTTVEDRGHGFDPASIPVRSIHADEHPSRVERPFRSERGRGLLLMRALVDEANFRSSNAGTSVDLMMTYDTAGVGVEH